MMINPMTPQRTAVLTVLQQAGSPMRLMEIAAALKVKPDNAAALLYRMREDGQADYVVVGPFRRWHAILSSTAAAAPYRQPPR